MSGSYHSFPDTRWTAIHALRGDDQARQLGLDVISRLYWQPVRSYISAKWPCTGADAEDLTQSFFAHALEKDLFAKFDSRQARFRTFLRTCLDRFLINAHNYQNAQKRGGGMQHVAIGNREESGVEPADPSSLEDLFEQEWRRSLFAAALDELEAACVTDTQKLQWELFRRYDLEPDAGERATYERLAADFGVTASTVTNHLHAIRTRLRAALLNQLRSITATEEEYQEESRLLLAPGRFGRKA